MANKKLLMIVSKGSMDMAYPPLMLATTAAAMGMEASLFFTFWGIDIVTRKKVDRLKISPVGNPSLPMPGLLGILPGMTAMLTGMMKGKMKKINMPSAYDMIKMAKEGGA
jgi:peroxiredoxin family protein